MLKIVTLTKDALGEFDWSSFILEELSQQIHKFNKESHKSKATKRKTVGGCVYFLMVASEHESAMAYWTDDGVKRASSDGEKKQKGSLTRLSRSRPSRHYVGIVDPHTMLTHQVRTTYFKLVSMLGEEMLALQDRLTESPNNQPSISGECEEDDEERDEEDDDKEIDEEDDEKEIEDEDDDNDKEIDDEDDEKEIEDEDDEKEIEDEDDHIVDIDDQDSHLWLSASYAQADTIVPR
ncbi:hypothetical protein K1719_032788 [Acacia pycnantha]|nr:hypothetical protein K1719_032788 [Acacia pycnantha]